MTTQYNKDWNNAYINSSPTIMLKGKLYLKKRCYKKFYYLGSGVKIGSLDTIFFGLNFLSYRVPQCSGLHTDL